MAVPVGPRTGQIVQPRLFHELDKLLLKWEMSDFLETPGLRVQECHHSRKQKSHTREARAEAHHTCKSPHQLQLGII